jgi:CRP/FNR family transcriptional regulator, cyclic AMP receptor protein
MPTVPNAHDHTYTREAVPTPDAAGPAPAPSRRVSLLDADAELRAAIPAPERLLARRVLRVPGYRFDPGEIDVPPENLAPATFALLVVRGSLRYEARVGAGRLIEVLSVGDLVLPFAPPAAVPSSCAVLTAVDEVRLAPLEHRFIRASARWPELMQIVQRRLHEQQHRLAVHAAIGQLPHVEQRLMGMMWHLADRIGKVSAEGIVLAQPLSHRALADLVGARRPTVSLALKALQEAGQLRRRGDGRWILPNNAGSLIVGPDG